MFPSSLRILLALLCLVPSLALRAQPSDDDLIINLPGLKHQINFKQYSGYLKADSLQETNKFFHYWFVESQTSPKSDPVVLWLNGGPGCSSLEGFFAELGPFKVDEVSNILSKNPYAWNRIANVLFMSSPAGVGFSYAKDKNLTTNDDDTANSNHLALRDFFRKFPQYKSNDLYLMGESYAGVYLPTLGVLVDEDKEMNLAGIGIGNGFLDAAKLSESLIYFSYYHSLYGQTLWKRISDDCCNGNPPARGSCNLGLSRSESCGYTIEEVRERIMDSGINLYNMYHKCKYTNNDYDINTNHQCENNVDFAGPVSLVNSRELFDRQLIINSLNLKYYKDYAGLDSDYSNGALQITPPCIDESPTIAYVNQQSVREAIHIPELVQPWDICSNITYESQYPGRPGGLAPQMKKLLASPRKLKLLVYNGDVDMMCNSIGDEWFVDDLGQKVLKEYEKWMVDGQVAGYYKHYEGISFMTILGSGHMVPQDKPKESYQFFKRFVSKEEKQLT